ncbi:mannitol 2-dehydrogenase [Pseudovibrio japonicus]|uniref:Mannitol 2-dehydrogenase n=1 Tax=Pseudovibrio japonicus TaxID=366534 RepID=A0ABQ3ESJ9_9HYPH|nr:mannitol dehydrogenase family protein [Pseudovibrio japonicus]GHB47921.1 mannitol 2-dehydrogenase [Pseudovibrio japonicus]
MLDLSLASLGSAPKIVATPGYDRQNLSAGILHIGVGNFHRAHMAHYLDRLLAKGLGHDWAIVGAGLKPGDAQMRDKLEAQDWLTTVVDLEADSANARVISAMIDYVDIAPMAILARLCDPAIRIVSLTVTEGGYFLDSAGAVIVDHPEIQADARNPEAPRTAFGLIIAALRRRREAGTVPFTVLSCDNLPANGKVVSGVVTALARMQDPALGDWIAAEVAFPNSMVDCITPRTGKKELALVRDRFGIEDAAPVICEPFRQWVIEDHFPAGRPPLEEVGVEFVEDVTTHEIMKLRLLNGSHASLCYAAALMGHEYVDAALADETLSRWLAELPRRETIPCLAPLEGVDYAAYLDQCIERFRNPAIADTIARLAENGSDRQPKFILPTIREALSRNLPLEGLALEIGLWAHFCSEKPIPLEDPLAETLNEAARNGAAAFVRIEGVFGDLSGNARLIKALEAALAIIAQKGVRGAIEAYLDRD